MRGFLHAINNAADPEERRQRLIGRVSKDARVSSSIEGRSPGYPLAAAAAIFAGLLLPKPQAITAPCSASSATPAPHRTIRAARFWRWATSTGCILGTRR